VSGGMDKLMQVNSLNGLTLQQRAWAAMHQDYSHEYVWQAIQQGKLPNDNKCGEILEKHLLKGNRGHFGPLEQLGITVACGFMPHSLMQQLRTHRISVTFDVQSFRYTSKGLLEVAENSYNNSCLDLIEKVVYLRPVGNYTDRQGHRYFYSEDERYEDLIESERQLQRYKTKLDKGFSEEHARGQLPFDIRQHFVLSFNNLRSLWHMLDMRWKADAQLEAQWFCDLLWEATKNEAPEMSQWYEDNRMKKARLAP
jgi:thymidylate synthase (FAD)